MSSLGSTWRQRGGEHKLGPTLLSIEKPGKHAPAARNPRGARLAHPRGHREDLIVRKRELLAPVGGHAAEAHGAIDAERAAPALDRVVGHRHHQRLLAVALLQVLLRRLHEW